MRRYLRISVGVLSAIVATMALAGPASASAQRTLTKTQRTIVRPVSSSGHAEAGYTVKSAGADPIDCSFKEASPAAVDANILYCSPSAAYAIACWRSATKHHVLCLPDARKKTLVKFAVSGSIASVKPMHVRLPLNVKLGNGLYCGLRDGGAAASLKNHPNWGVLYYCTDNRAIWSPFNKDGINRKHAVWRVHVARSDGNGTLVTRAVTQAWFVGTKF